MKKTLFLLFFVSIFLVVIPKSASAQTPEWDIPLFQRIEILKQEVRLLQSLVLNMRPQPGINAPSYLAIDLSNDSILLEKDANQSYSMASVTKLMSAIVAVENIEKNQTIVLTEKMLEPLGGSPSLFLGLRISVENLVKASLVQSTNDASEALAYFLGKEKFIALMNEKAKSIGMKNTVFYDVHGLSPANRSTATDLAKLLSYVHEQHPEILEITKNNNFWLPNSSGKLLKFQNVNNFYPLRDFVGGKTGYLPQAKQTLASVFSVNGKDVAITLLYSGNRQADVFTILNQLKQIKF